MSSLDDIDESKLTESQREHLNHRHEDQQSNGYGHSLHMPLSSKTSPKMDDYNGGDMEYVGSPNSSERSPTSRSRITTVGTSAVPVSARRHSTQSVKNIQSESNPLASSAVEVEKILLRVENLSGARLITDKELNELVALLTKLE